MLVIWFKGMSFIYARSWLVCDSITREVEQELLKSQRELWDLELFFWTMSYDAKLFTPVQCLSSFGSWLSVDTD